MPRPSHRHARTNTEVTLPMGALIEYVRTLHEIPDDAELVEVTYPDGWAEDRAIKLTFVLDSETVEVDFD